MFTDTEAVFLQFSFCDYLDGF